MKAFIYILFVGSFLCCSNALIAQFSPEKFSRNDKFEIAPLVTSSTTTLKSLFSLKAGTMATIEQNANEIIELRIFDVNGILMFRKLLNSDFDNYNIDLSDFAAGAYIVEVRQGYSTLSTKIIRRHH